MSGALSSLAFKLTVLSGPHIGVTRALTAAEFTIGSGWDNTIVLRDSDIASTHVRLRLHRQRIVVESLEAGLTLRGGQTEEPLAAGGQRVVRPPVTLVLGNTALILQLDHARLLTQQADPMLLPPPSGAVREKVAPIGGGSWARWRDALNTQRRWPVYAGVACAALLLALGLRQALLSFDRPLVNQPLPQTASASDPRDAQQASTIGDASEAANADDDVAPRAVAWLEAEIQARALQRKLSVERFSDKIEVSGTVTKQQRPTWQNIRQSFDDLYGGQIALIGTVEVMEETPPPPPIVVRAIYLDEPPYVIAADGTRYYIGAVLSGGWQIVTINDDGVAFEREDQRIVIRL